MNRSTWFDKYYQVQVFTAFWLWVRGKTPLAINQYTNMGQMLIPHAQKPDWNEKNDNKFQLWSRHRYFQEGKNLQPCSHCRWY